MPSKLSKWHETHSIPSRQPVRRIDMASCMGVEQLSDWIALKWSFKGRQMGTSSASMRRSRLKPRALRTNRWVCGWWLRRKPRQMDTFSLESRRRRATRSRRQQAAWRRVEASVKRVLNAIVASFQDLQPHPGLWSRVRGAILCMGCFTITRTRGGRAVAWGQRRILSEVATVSEVCGCRGRGGTSPCARTNGAACWHWLSSWRVRAAVPLKPQTGRAKVHGRLRGGFEAQSKKPGAIISELTGMTLRSLAASTNLAGPTIDPSRGTTENESS